MRLLPLIAFATLPAIAAAEDVTLFAAASMKTALDPIAAQFQAATGYQVAISYAGSNTLAQQIMNGAPADIFISASPQWMDEVEKAGQIAPGTRTDLLGNRLVLVAHDAAATRVELGPETDLTAMLDGGKLAMALVDSVPAGQYGKAALTSLGLWDVVAPHVAQADNVRAALALVSSGEAPLGIVYATDAAADPAVHVIGSFPQTSHDPIVYPAARLAHGTDPADAAFLAALDAPAADERFRAQGFVVLD